MTENDEAPGQGSPDTCSSVSGKCIGASAFERIPAELQDRHQWVVWRFEARAGKRTKVPYVARRPLNRGSSGTRSRWNASTTDSNTWRSFTEAVVVAREGDWDGIGFVFTEHDPYVGVDLDLELAEADRASVALKLSSYTEESVSGGWHVVIRASLNGHGRHPQGVGIFDRGRYFVFTGNHVTGTPTTIEERQDELDAVIAEFIPPEPERDASPSEPVDLDDQDLLERAFAAKNGAVFRALWEGRWQGLHSSQSEADLDLCGRLAFWTGRDQARVDRMFRASGLHRDKWSDRRKESTYGDETIAKAIAGCRNVYTPPVAGESGVTSNPDDATSDLLAQNVTPTLNRPDLALIEPRGVPTDFPGEFSCCGLDDVLSAFGDLLILPDPGPVKIALASVVANYAPGDVVWPLLVGPPGCGKSEIVTALREAPSVWPLSSLTPQTLLSGYERKGKDKGPPASMLIQIGAFGILAFKDLTTVLTMHREARAQIIGQLREVADGSTEKSFGNGLRLEWKGKLGLIAGVTPVIDEQHSFLAVMGERFLLYRMPEVARRDIAHRSLRRRGREEELRERIRGLVADFLRPFRDVGRLELPEHYTEPLITLVDIVTRARTGVARDYQTRDILYLPEPEAPTRLAKQVAQLMAALIAIGVDEAEAWRLAQKVGWDSVPAVRSAVIHLLSRQDGDELTRAELQERTGLPETTIRRVEEDLVVLGLAEHRKEKDAANARWLIRESKLAAEYWDSDREPA
jgi:hypothetical protein